MDGDHQKRAQNLAITRIHHGHIKIIPRIFDYEFIDKTHPKLRQLETKL